MKYFVVLVLIGLLLCVSGQTFNGTFEWSDDGSMEGSCGIVYNTFYNKIALISDKWFSSDLQACKCNLKVDYQGKSITVAISGKSADGEDKNKVELSYAAFYALNPSNTLGYNAVFTFVDCQ
uniref:Uncharacterized protein n=1 Tax=Panagrolaimus sp. PS1159 TaxID=55785 RepID=A0AC35FUQ2_9BILA